MLNTYKASQQLYKLHKNTTNYIPGEIADRIYIASQWIGSNKIVLDAGCYDGSYGVVFLRNNNKVYGIDASNDAVRKAIKNGIKAIVCDLEGKFPFKDNFFNAIHAGEVIEHLYDTDTFIRECKRVLKKGGLLSISTANTLSLPRRILYLMGMGRFFEASNTFSTEGEAVGHIRFFSYDLLKNFIEHNGFKLVKFTSDYVNFPFFRSRLLAKIKPTFGMSLIMLFIKK